MAETHECRCKVSEGLRSTHCPQHVPSLFCWHYSQHCVSLGQR
jgi:hypothetical protein